MKLIIGCIHIVLLFMLARWVQKREKNLGGRLFWSALILKVLCGCAMGLIYTYYYTVGDTFQYFQNGSTLAHLARNDFESYVNLMLGDRDPAVLSQLTTREPRTLFFNKIVSVFNLLTLDNYWIMATYFSVISFFGNWYLVRQINKFFPRITPAAVVSFLFLPSAVFWTSGLIKESISVALLCLLVALFLKFWHTGRLAIYEVVAALVAAWLVWVLKYYFAAIFFPVIIATTIYKVVLLRVKIQKAFVHVLLWGSAFVIPLAIVMMLRPNFHPENFFAVIVTNYQAFHISSDPQDVIYFNGLKPEMQSVLSHMPWAVLSGLFRPFVWEAGNKLQFLIGLENIALLFLALFSVRAVRSGWKSEHRILIFSVIVYIVLLSGFITLSTPNFGTLCRYRVGYLPFFTLLVMSHRPVTNFLQTVFHRLAL